MASTTSSLALQETLYYSNMSDGEDLIQREVNQHVRLYVLENGPEGLLDLFESIKAKGISHRRFLIAARYLDEVPLSIRETIIHRSFRSKCVETLEQALFLVEDWWKGVEFIPILEAEIGQGTFSSSDYLIKLAKSTLGALEEMPLPISQRVQPVGDDQLRLYNLLVGDELGQQTKLALEVIANTQPTYESMCRAKREFGDHPNAYRRFVRFHDLEYTPIGNVPEGCRWQVLTPSGQWEDTLGSPTYQHALGFSDDHGPTIYFQRRIFDNTGSPALEKVEIYRGDKRGSSENTGEEA